MFKFLLEFNLLQFLLGSIPYVKTLVNALSSPRSVLIINTVACTQIFLKVPTKFMLCEQSSMGVQMGEKKFQYSLQMFQQWNVLRYLVHYVSQYYQFYDQVLNPIFQGAIMFRLNVLYANDLSISLTLSINVDHQISVTWISFEFQFVW